MAELNSHPEDSAVRRPLADLQRTHPLPWWAAGLLLGLVQVLAIALVKPMGVSKPFIVADTKVLNRVAPEYSENHPLLSDEQYKSSATAGGLISVSL